MYHLASAGVTGVVYPVPARVYWPDDTADPDFTTLRPWIEAAQARGLRVLLHVGPFIDAGLPTWGMSAHIAADIAQGQGRMLRRWWASIRDALPHDGVTLWRRPPLSEATWQDLVRVWEDTDRWDVADWTHLDVRDLEWQEWESDAAWWEQVDRASSAHPVHVRAWWVAPGRAGRVPTPEIAHEALGEAFARTLLISLWARGVQHIWWDPIRGGTRLGDFPILGWGTSLDGGAAFHAWGMPTITWRGIKRALLQAQALAVAQARWQPHDEEDGGTIALGEHGQGKIHAFRYQYPGDVEFTLPIKGHTPARVRVTGPGAWLFPSAYALLDGRATLLAASVDVLWRAQRADGEVWVVDIRHGGDWVLRGDAELLYETGVTLAREGDVWRVVFTPGQQGQVVWQIGRERLQVVGLDALMADRLWAQGLWEAQPVFAGPDQVLDLLQLGDKEQVLRVVVDYPTALVAFGEHPMQMRVIETGKASIWGERARMAGVRLGGPKEWGAPGVRVPDLVWESVPLVRVHDVPAGSEEHGRVEVALSPGWHRVDVVVPSEVEELSIQVYGVCDVWLGGRRIQGIRALSRATARRIVLPPRAQAERLTFFLWVPTPPGDTSEEHGGVLAVEGPGEIRWQHTAGLPGVTFEGGAWRWLGTPAGEAAQADSPGVVVWAHRALFEMDVPDGVWVQFGLQMGDVGELVWVFLNGVLVGQWWAGRSRELALWLPPDILRYRGANDLVLVHWPRAQEVDLTSVRMVQLGRERVSTVRLSRA